jgi:hypothetical protein
VRQERNGKFILIGLFDAIGAPRFPMRHGRLFVVSRWCSGQGRFEQSTRIVRPDQVTPMATSRPVALNLPTAEAVATHVDLFVNLAFPEPGVYWVEILLDGDLRLRYPLRVNQLQQPSGQATPPSDHTEP